MTPAAAIPVFLASVALMLGAAAVFAGKLDHMGIRLGWPETVLGLLTAIAADAPELVSAVTALVENRHAEAVGVVVGASAFNLAAMLGLSALVAARIRARHEALEVEAFVGLWIVVASLAVVGGWIGGEAGLFLVALVAVPYVFLLVSGPRRVRRLPFGIGRTRLIRRSFGEAHRRERTLDSRREVLRIVLVLLVALCVIIAGGIATVRTANVLADAWSIPEAIVGVIVLAIISALPNAWTGVRFGLQHRGSALMSETLNSNSINLAVGITLAATIGRLGSPTHVDVFNVAWVLGMTAIAVVLFGRRGGGGRVAGGLLIALYAVFVAVQFATS
jgi:cation:H+ antiporter